MDFMGTIRFRRAAFLACVSETVGYTSGLTLDFESQLYETLRIRIEP